MPDNKITENIFFNFLSKFQLLKIKIQSDFSYAKKCHYPGKQEGKNQNLDLNHFESAGNTRGLTFYSCYVLQPYHTYGTT